MSYSMDSLQQQLQDIQQKYSQLSSYSNQAQLFPNPPQQTPPPMVQAQPLVQSHQIQYVEGLNGARLYQSNKLPLNSSEVIFDKDEDKFYLVSKDANGTPAKKIPVARFTIEEQVGEEEPVFLTRKDFDDFKEEIRQMLSTKKVNSEVTKT